MPALNPIALYPSYDELKNIDLTDFPSILAEISDDEWKKDTWLWGQDFLSYIGRNKSEHTYTRFRSEVEKFLMWAFQIKKEPIDLYRKKDILEYADFCWQPPENWITLVNQDKFLLNSSGVYQQNEVWAPFRLLLAKSDNSKPDKKNYRPSQEKLNSVFTALNAFYKHLTGNPKQNSKSNYRNSKITFKYNMLYGFSFPGAMLKIGVKFGKTRRVEATLLQNCEDRLFFDQVWIKDFL